MAFYQPIKPMRVKLTAGTTGEQILQAVAAACKNLEWKYISGAISFDTSKMWITVNLPKTDIERSILFRVPPAQTPGAPDEDRRAGETYVDSSQIYRQVDLWPQIKHRKDKPLFDTEDVMDEGAFYNEFLRQLGVNPFRYPMEQKHPSQQQIENSIEQEFNIEDCRNLHAWGGGLGDYSLYDYDLGDQS